MQSSVSLPSALFALTLAFLRGASADLIDLNVPSLAWNYTADNGLYPNTSDDCLAAFAAPIDCDDTLLAISMDFANGIHAAAPNLGRLCERKCKDSLEDYTQQLGLSCTEGDDQAIQTMADRVRYIHVFVIGQILEYNYAQACLKAANGDYCFSGARNSHVTPDCSDQCNINFYRNTHDFAPASYKRFNYTTLVPRTTYWIGQFKNGYAAVEKCPGFSNSSGIDHDHGDGRGHGKNTATTIVTPVQQVETATAIGSGSKSVSVTASATASPTASPPAAANGVGEVREGIVQASSLACILSVFWTTISWTILS